MALVFDDKALGFCFSLWVVQCRLLRGGFDVGLVAGLGAMDVACCFWVSLCFILDGVA